MTKFKVGDTVSVIHNGGQYTNYKSWITQNATEYNDMFEIFKNCPYATRGKIVAIENHSASRQDTTLILIKVRNNVFLFDEYSLKPIKIIPIREEDLIL
jgi:hypothetical protein